MKVYPLTLEESVEHKANLGVDLTYADFTDADAAQTIELFDVLATMGVHPVKAVLGEVFDSSDATLTSTTIEVGDGGDTDRFLTSTELNTSGTEVYVKAGALTGPYQYTADDTVDATVGCTALKLLSTHTQGKLRLYFQVTDPRAIAP